VRAAALTRLQQITAPPPEPGSRTERVRVGDFFEFGALDSAASVDEAIDRAVAQLKAHLHKLLAQGAQVILE
jgi:hypothetical protein